MFLRTVQNRFQVKRQPINEAVVTYKPVLLMLLSCSGSEAVAFNVRICVAQWINLKSINKPIQNQIDQQNTPSASELWAEPRWPLPSVYPGASAVEWKAWNSHCLPAGTFCLTLESVHMNFSPSNLWIRFPLCVFVLALPPFVFMFSWTYIQYSVSVQCTSVGTHV